MGRQTPEEIRKEVLDNDDTKDVSIYMSIPIGVLAGISAAAGLCAVIVMRAMVYFREGIDAYWLTCVPFLFPVITGLFAAYKKQFSLLGVHLAVTLLAMVMGGMGFAISIGPIFIDRQDCVPANPGMACDKHILTLMYVIAGSLAAGFAVLGFLLTLCGIYTATKRLAQREREAEIAHYREQEEKQRELRLLKHNEGLKPRTLSTSSPGPGPASAPAPAPNGVANNKPSADQAANPSSPQEAGNVTTRL